MLFIATLMLKDKQTGKIIFTKYVVDLLRDHVVSGIDIYNTCVATTAITNTQFVMPKVLRPLLVGLANLYLKFTHIEIIQLIWLAFLIVPLNKWLARKLGLAD